MPVVRVCPHCKKSMIASTYQMMNHVMKKCTKFKNSSSNKINIIRIASDEKNFNIKKNNNNNKNN